MRPCYNDLKYNPDYEMTKSLISKVGCNLPWSRLQFHELGTCSKESEFQSYFKYLVGLKSDIIKKMPKKCNFNSWTSVPFEESSVVDGNGTTSLKISFYVDEKKVKENHFGRT